MNVKILGIVGSPRSNSNTEVLIREALQGAEEVGNVETEILLLAGKKILPCISCYKCVENKDLCIFRHKDYMHEFYEKWLYADGLIIGCPVYHLSVPGILKNALDRLGEGITALRFASVIRSHWFCKVGGVIAQGMATHGGQEFTAQFLVNHLLLMNTIVVPPELASAPGVVGTFFGKKIFEAGVIRDYDPVAVQNSRLLGKRVAEITKIVKTGVEQLKNELPEEYIDYVLSKNGCNKILSNSGDNPHSG